MTFGDSCALLSCRIFCTLYVRKKFLYIGAGRLHMDIKDETKSTMEITAIPPIVSTYRHALQTFDVNFKSHISSNLSRLKSMMDSIKAEDLGFDNMLRDPRTWMRMGKAPCTYVEVFQDNLINMSIFVLRPGFKMPLHDHPHMHGLLKVIAGAVNIRSFSEYPVTEMNNADFAMRARYEAARLAQGFHRGRRLFAEISANAICTETSPTCVLTPTISNYHEIQALDMPAAFFDILAPPYDTMIEGIGPRRCRYYHIVNEISTNLVELQETEVPDCFYCDQAPYLGPPLR